MTDADPISSNSNSSKENCDKINKIDLRFSIDTTEMIIGAVFVNSLKSPEDTVVGKVFIYKYTNPRFIEVNFDESYLNYLFEDSTAASRDIADYTLKMLTLDFPGSVLNMSSSTDIGLVQLPQSIYNK
jgi:hypothetical protein